MPIVKLLDRNILHIYDRFDSLETNGRKKLLKGEEKFISDEALFSLKRLGVHFEVVGEDAPVEEPKAPPVEEKPEVEEPVLDEPIEEPKDKPVEETEEPVEEKPETEEVEFGGEVLTVTKSKKKKRRKK